MNDRTVMKSPPRSVTAQRGMDSKKPADSMAVTISSGSAAPSVAENPAADMMVAMSPCTTSTNASISSSP